MSAGPSIELVAAPVRVANCDGAERYIPAERAAMRIDAAWLEEKGACQSAQKAFAGVFPEGCSYLELRVQLAELGHNEYESWLLCNVGGDVATAGDSGTATAGEAGVISILYWDAKHGRYRMIIGYIGEGGLLPGVAYRLNEHAQFVRADGKEVP